VLRRLVRPIALRPTLFRKQLLSTTPPKPKDRGRLDAKIDDVRKRLTLLRTDAPAPADAQSTFLSALAFGLVHARHIRIVLVALFALMCEVTKWVVRLEFVFTARSDNSNRRGQHQIWRRT
jgi:hypothetical protein